MTVSVAQALTAVAHDAAPRPAQTPPGHRTTPPACPCPRPDILADRPDGTVVRHGDVVAKSHAPDTDPAALTARIAVAAHPLLAGILLPPLPVPAAARGGAFTTVLHGRPLTLWPYGTPVDPEDPDAAPWEDAATLLARLHAIAPGALQLPAPLPPMRGPAKAARAIARMRAATGPHPASTATATTTAATTAVLRAWAGLPAWARDEAPPPHGRAALCHGDLHLGQLVRHPAGAPSTDRWLLIDVDDMGIGDPAWDLARPAAWYAAGLLAPDVWDRFLGAYRSAGGTAVRPDGDPWPQLDVPARALTVQTAALALAKSAADNRPLDEVEEMMIEACARIASLPPELAYEATP
ncbi:aminoglycoside phosphotransferase family protein [Streptomyces flavidovirens]|uniref:phosphotransferase n=1 Tax=Streptomyces flavidovirens TaxID=67298 RepID=UPI0003FE9950|nr:aminoglycoside phosphotransferase family protein [Streptomyces flavidovirens]